MPLSPLLQAYDQVILDLDGCVWIGDQATLGAPEAVAALRAAGKAVIFATNNSWHPGEEHVTRLWALGIQASLTDVVTVGGAVQHLLAETRPGRGAFVIGQPSLMQHVSDAGLRVLNGSEDARSADVVLVGSTDAFDYDSLRTAVLAVRAGADLLATSRDSTLPTPEGYWPGTGALLSAVEVASERTGSIVGKPEPQLFFTALDRLDGDGDTLVVGDRLDSDVGGAAAAGLDAALVLTGSTGREEAEAAKDPKPVAIAETLAELVGTG